MCIPHYYIWYKILISYYMYIVIHRANVIFLFQPLPQHFYFIISSRLIDKHKFVQLYPYTFILYNLAWTSDDTQTTNLTNLFCIQKVSLSHV